MRIGLNPKPIRNIHDKGPETDVHHIDVEQAKTQAARILVRRAMDHEDPDRRIDLGAHSRADNAHRLRGLLLEELANDPDEPVITMHRRDAEDLERHAIGAIDDAIREQEGRSHDEELQLH